jgi:hypothetical protein
MSVVDKLRGYVGVRNWLDSKKHVYNKEKELNSLFLEFAKDMNWIEVFAKDNSKKYKGSFKPFIYNGWLCSCNFQMFKNWYKKKNEILNQYLKL